MFATEGSNVINEMKRFQEEMSKYDKNIIDPSKLIKDYDNKLSNKLFN